MNILWFIPTHGDGRYLGSAKGARQADYPYFKQIAQAADQLGYTGVLLPTGRSCEDPWLTAAALAAETTHLKFLVALRPGLMQPSVAARMTSTLDRLSGGRLLINVVAGGSKEELEGDGLFISHDERYEATEEFLTIWKRLLKGENVQFHGKHLQAENGRLLFPPAQTPIHQSFWRIISSRNSSNRQAYRCLFNLGRTACTSERENYTSEEAG